MNESTNIGIAQAFAKCAQGVFDMHIKSAIKLAKHGIDKYITIMDMFKAGLKTAEDQKKFERLFNGFYRVRRNAQWRSEYYSIMDWCKRSIYDVDRAMDFDAILHSLARCTDGNKYEPSFVSKLLATVDPNKPIWDKWVFKNTGLKAPAYTDPDKFNKAVKIYDEIEKWYYNCLTSDAGRRCIELFNETYPKSITDKITDVKKIDFILWQLR